MGRFVETVQTLWFVLLLTTVALAISWNRRCGRWLIRRYMRLSDWEEKLPC